jgi:hypothetical protein
VNVVELAKAQTAMMLAVRGLLVKHVDGIAFDVIKVAKEQGSLAPDFVATCLASLIVTIVEAIAQGNTNVRDGLCSKVSFALLDADKAVEIKRKGG